LRTPVELLGKPHEGNVFTLEQIKEAIRVLEANQLKPDAEGRISFHRAGQEPLRITPEQAAERIAQLSAIVAKAKGGT
jgi:hypothetical protein